MPDEAELSPTERLLALWEYLGLGAAHVATPIPGDLSPLASRHPPRVAGIVLCVPSRLDPAPFAAVAERVLMIGAERGPSAEATTRAAAVLPAAGHVVLAGYEAPGSWADAVADRGDEISGTMIDFLGRLAGAGHPADTPRAVAAEGRPCRHHLPHSRRRPGASLAAVFSGAVAMGAGDRGLDAAFHGRDPGRTVFGRRRLARRPRSEPQLSGDVPRADRPHRAAARRGDPRSRLRRRLAGAPLGKAARRRQSDHRCRRQPVSAARGGGAGDGRRPRRGDPFHPRQRRGIAVSRPFLRLRLFGDGARGMRRRSRDCRNPPRAAAGRARRDRGARARHEAMVEPRFARADPAQDRHPALFGRPRRASPTAASIAACARRGLPTSSAFRPWSRSTGPAARSGATARTTCCRCCRRKSAANGRPSATAPPPTACCSWPIRCIAPSASNRRIDIMVAPPCRDIPVSWIRGVIAFAPQAPVCLTAKKS